MDYPHPDITVPDGGAGGEPLEGTVRERILRLHPQAGEGAGTVMRKAAGWDQAGTFAAEVMSRFRSPFAVTPMAMPLAQPVAESRIAATGSAPVLDHPSRLSPDRQRPLPAAGSSSSERLGPGNLVQRKVMRGSDSTTSTSVAGTVAEPFFAPEKLVEAFHKSRAGSDGYESKADVSPQPLSSPMAAGTWAMTLGARLVQRHSSFVGTLPEKEAGEGSPSSLQRMPMAAGVASSEASVTPHFDEASASAVSSAVAPFPQAVRRDGSASGANRLPVIQRTQPGGGASGVVSRKSNKETLTGPELSRGGPRTGVSETAGAAFLPRTDFFSPTVPANTSGSVLSAPLPLLRMRGTGGSIQRKLSDSASVMQRAETDGASVSATPAGGTSETAAGLSLGGSPETGVLTPTPGTPVDLERVADEVYRIIERRLIVEKENRGL